MSEQDGHIRFGMSDTIITHVIAMSEYEKLKKQNDILIEALISYSKEQHHGFTAREALARVKELETKQGE